MRRLPLGTCSTERWVALDDARRFSTAAAVAEEFGQLKGALMKLGQMASYLDEGLPEPLRMGLARPRRLITRAG